MNTKSVSTTAVVGVIGGLLMAMTLFLPWVVIDPDAEIDLSSGTGVLIGNAFDGSTCAGSEVCDTGPGASYTGSKVGVSYIALFGLLLGGMSLLLASRPEKNLSWIFLALVAATLLLVLVLWSGDWTSGPDSGAVSAGIGFKLGLIGFFLTAISASRFLSAINEDTKAVRAITGATSSLGYFGLVLAVLFTIFA